MTDNVSARRSTVLRTRDTFIAEVPWNERHTVVVFRREHGGRVYVRLRTWNHRQDRPVSYPTDRCFVVPVQHADALAKAVVAGGKSRPMGRRPRWCKVWREPSPGPSSGRNARGKNDSDSCVHERFIAAVPWGVGRSVVVIHRKYRGQDYVRFRTWNRHRSQSVWYPSKRFYVIPAHVADALAGALLAAASGKGQQNKPAWYRAWKRADLSRYALMVDLFAPDEVLAAKRCSIKRKWKRSV